MKTCETLDDAALRLLHQTVTQLYDAVRNNNHAGARVLTRRLERVCAYLQQTMESNYDMGRR